MSATLEAVGKAAENAMNLMPPIGTDELYETYYARMHRAMGRAALQAMLDVALKDPP